MTEQDRSPITPSSSLGVSIPIRRIESNSEVDSSRQRQEKEEKRPYRPVITIDLQRLVGYSPSSHDAFESIQTQLVEAMWTRYRQDYGDDDNHECSDKNNNNNDNINKDSNETVDEPQSPGSKESTTTSTDVRANNTLSYSGLLQLPADFDIQIQELLDAKMAQFDVSSSATVQAVADGKSDDTAAVTPQDQWNYCTLVYPQKIRNPLATSSSDTWLDTAQAWKDIQGLSQVSLPPPVNRYNDSGSSDCIPDNDDNIDEASHLLFLKKLTQHLLATRRPLTWKHAMATELQHCLRQQVLERQHEEWVQSQRQAKLDNLYTVRETLVLQTELSKQSYRQLCARRDEQVLQDLLIMQQQEQQSSSAGSTSAFRNDWQMSALELAEELQKIGFVSKQYQEEVDEDENVFHDEDEYLGSSSSDEINNIDDEDNDDSSFCASIDGYRDSDDSIIDTQEYDADEDGGNLTAESTFTGNTTAEDGDDINNSDSPINPLETAIGEDSATKQQTLSIPFQRRQERRQKAKRRKRKERMEAEKQARREALQASAEKLREKHTTREMILAQTKLQAYEEKVKNVDELLEKLQDEVWEAEEEQEEDLAKSSGMINNRSDEEESYNNNLTTISLLDQVLAMILGALPADPNKTTQEHCEYIKQEHETVVAGWKAYFGRLPPPAFSKKQNETDGYGKGSVEETPTTEIPRLTPAEQRAALGIADNENEEWDEDDKEN
ncbi:hypothetical protein IV203_030333 [Nitzschia inconspicua]|uniref:Uncharacterized protein n=1 Tax=Nitzschia inconspicua TaxID=303405 RepID=A0A9K3Q169_9STRA|nr:hypothetical protein IV203_030333 [Nitzschia inconspicua]